MVKNLEHAGYSPAILPSFGVIKIVIATLSLIPSTSFVGVILATGWMGGAISAHVRVKDQYVVQVIIPVLIWIGLGLFLTHYLFHSASDDIVSEPLQH